MNTGSNINERIKILRKELGYSQREFAEKLRLKQTTISFLERNGSTVTEQNVLLICKEFGINENWLLTGNGEKCEKSDEDIYTRAVAEIGIKDKKAQQAIIDYWKLSEEDKKLFWKFVEKFLNKKES